MGTSTEYLGRRPLPHILRQRPFLLILGPTGVGKTSVAFRILGQAAISLRGEDLQEASVRAVRRQSWPSELIHAPSLVIDGPTFLQRRPGATRLLLNLIRDRTAQGCRTAVCQGEGDDSATLLVEAVEPELRATLTLRYPTRQGRQRFALRMCQQLGIDPAHARRVQVPEPWTYEGVIAALEAASAASDPASRP